MTIIFTFLHEFAHMILREIKNNFLTLTPRTQASKNLMEIGYRFEEILFGSIVALPEKCSKIIDIENWTKIPLLDPEIIKELKKEYKHIAFCFSGICPMKILLGFR